MPWAPKPRCQTCGRIGCREHVKTRGERRTPRPEYASSEQVARRRATVQAWLSEHGITLENGDVIARCPECGQMRARFVADHVIPLKLGGSEDGPLRVHCRSCSGRQGAALTNRRGGVRTS